MKKTKMSQSEEVRQHWACSKKGKPSGGTSEQGTYVTVGHEAAQEGWVNCLYMLG